MGGLGMGGQRNDDFIERYGWYWEWREGWEWENAYRLENTTVDKSMMRVGNGRAYIDLKIFCWDLGKGHIGSGGRFGNGRANIYILDNMEDKS